MLQLQDVSKQYGSKVLFEGANLRLGNRSRVALVGPNGAGKSTLIRILLGLESPDSGSVSRASHLSIGHLAQEVPKFSGRTVLSEVMRMDGRLEELQAAQKELEEAFAGNTNSDDPEALERYGRVLEELDHLDQYRLESRAKEILSGLGFKTSDFDRALTTFSGGWLMRVALSRILLMDPDLLLLDEPTNHLDLESLLWLEEFLRAHQGAMLLVSHDRAFLNRMVTEVFEIDQRKIATYRGNIDAYATQKEERLAVLRSQYAGQQAKIAELESFVARFRAKATKASQAQSRLKQLEKMERIELSEEASTVRFRFPPASHSGREVVTFKNAGLTYGAKKVYQDLNWVLMRGSRVAIVGVNGAGKTSLLKLLSGALAPTEGVAKLGHLVQVGYYAQHQAESLNMHKTVLQELETIAPDMPMAKVRAIAGAFLFSGDAVDKKCAVLSGGEKARVALAKLLLSPSNFLILDEPTNHLDAQSREVLLEALQGFEGTLCLVSHDREFMAPLVDQVLEIEPAAEGSGAGSRVVPLLGSYDEYLTRKIKEAQGKPSLKSTAPAGNGVALNESNPAAASTSTSSSANPKRASNNQIIAWEKERDKLEIRITELEILVSDLNRKLADTSTYDDKAKSLVLMEEQRQMERKLYDTLSRWEELSLLLAAEGKG